MCIVIDRKKESINEILSDEQIQGFSFFRQPIHVGTRKIHSSVTLEAQQDIKAMRGIDVMKSMLDSLSYEMTTEIDKEFFRQMLGRIEIIHFDRVIHLCLTAKNYHLKIS